MTAKTFTTTHLATIYPHQTSVTLHGHFHLSVIYPYGDALFIILEFNL